MRLHRHRYFLIIVLLICLPMAASAETLMDALRQYAKSRSTVILLHRPYVLRGTDKDPFQADCAPFDSEMALVKRLNEIGYRCTRTGSVLACQFESDTEVQGLFLLSQREYETLFDASYRLISEFREDVARPSLFSERLIDSFPEDDRKRLETGIPVSSFTQGQRHAMEKWMFNAAFSWGADLISDSFRFKQVLRPDTHISIEGQELVLYWRQDGEDRNMHLVPYHGDSRDLASYRETGPGEAETLGHLAERVGNASSVTVTVEDTIKDHELTVLGDVERTEPVALMQSVAALGEWVCTPDAGGKSIEVRGRRTGLSNRSVRDIDPLLHRLIGEYVVRALYVPNTQRVLEQIEKETLQHLDNPRPFDIRKDAILRAAQGFKRVLIMGLISDLRRFKTQTFPLSALTERERTFLQAVLATDIYSTVGPQARFIPPPWFAEINSGTIFASFYQDGKFTRSNVKLRLPRGDKFEDVCYSDGTLYHADLGY